MARPIRTGGPDFLEDLIPAFPALARQEDGKWQAADDRIGQLDDRVLLGHVMAQRYLHPTAYRSKYRELKTWLTDYADHPQAKRIHRLAKKRRPNGAAAPRAPERISMRLRSFPEVAPHQSTKKLNKAERHRARDIKRQVRRNVLRTRLTVTEKLLNGPEARRLLDLVEIDEARAQVAAAWLGGGFAWPGGTFWRSNKPCSLVRIP